MQMHSCDLSLKKYTSQFVERIYMRYNYVNCINTSTEDVFVQKSHESRFQIKRQF